MVVAPSEVNVKILVTGGMGYIGSHTCIELIQAGFEPIIIDNLCNSKLAVLARIEAISGISPTFYQGDIRDCALLDEIFSTHQVQSVIHFAGLKAVGESAEKPVEYYQVNVAGTLSLIDAMQRAKVHNIVFSSSATVYGPDAPIPYVETLPTGPCNVYGRTKHMVEEILIDLCNMPNSDWKVSLLRYFNPIGAHASGLIGEDPQGIPNNLMPYIAQVAVGKLECLQVFGSDYPTPDGTGVRDYIHVVDLSKGHVQAVAKLAQCKQGYKIYNLGAGKGYSVLEMIKAFEAASALTIQYAFSPRREGDLAEFYADPTRAKNELDWVAELGIEKMMEDTWRWQSNNPTGYPGR
jgi:UDP-galactose 4-epimerase (EC 5.1.3.2)